MGRKKTEKIVEGEPTIEEISAEEVLEQYNEEQPEAQDEGDNLETIEEEA